jgi:hypothetical protein
MTQPLARQVLTQVPLRQQLAGFVQPPLLERFLGFA